MVATQAPEATTQDLENYLALLTDDVGHSHLPYVTDDSREPDGKQAMRKGIIKAPQNNAGLFSNTAKYLRR